MVVYERKSSMPWNLEKLRFLYPPDDFTGSFTNPKMQERLKAMQEEKIRILVSKLENAADPYLALRVLNPGDHIRFLANNIEAFIAHEKLESTVFELFFQKNTPFVTAGDPMIWDTFFRRCDPSKSRKLGTALPSPSVTAYRGSVTGISKGYCWTISREEVTWVLDRWQDKELGGGTVYRATLTPEDILIYRQHEHRREAVILPSVLDRIEPQAITSLDAA